MAANVGDRPEREQAVKRSCKDIDMRDPSALLPWVEECVHAHYRSRKFRRLLTSVGGMSRAEYDAAVETMDRSMLAGACELVAEECARVVSERDMSLLTPVRIVTKMDRSTGKMREIGSECAMQQVLDMVAVKASSEVWSRRMVPQQVSSVKGGGQVRGMAEIREWVSDDDRAERWAKAHGKKYSRKVKDFAIVDLEKYFRNLLPGIFMSLFTRDCANRDLVWLWGALLRTHGADGYPGVMIGALTSQWAAQYVLSFVYRHIMDMRKERRGKKVKVVTKMLMQMDDQLICARSRRDLMMAVREAISYCRSLCLSVKPTWQAKDIAESGIDMMGFVVHRSGKVTVRPRIFKRLRRMLLRAMRRRVLALSQAKRICSLMGWLKHSDHRKAYKKLRVKEAMRKASVTVSYYAKKEREHANAGNVLFSA